MLSDSAPTAPTSSAPTSAADPDGLETTAFDGTVQLLERIEEDIVQLMVDQVRQGWFDGVSGLVCAACGLVRFSSDLC